MRIRRLVAGLAFSVSLPLLLHSQAAHQGRVAFPLSETRIVTDSHFGNYSTLGLGASVLGWGVDAEMPFGPSIRGGGRRFEYQPSVEGSISPKVHHRNGAIEGQQNIEVQNQGLIWIVHRVGARGGYRYATYWAEGLNNGATPPVRNLTYTIHKSLWAPSLGVVIRDNYLGRPGRFYANYLFAAGCEQATPSNPCRLQSARMHGIELTQELRLTTYFRVSGQLAVMAFHDPSFSSAPAVPRVGHTAVYATIHWQFEWRSSPLNDEGIY